MPKGVLKYDLLDERQKHIVEQFIESLGTLSPRRIKKYRHYLGKIRTEFGQPFESVSRKAPSTTSNRSTQAKTTRTPPSGTSASSR